MPLFNVSVRHGRTRDDARARLGTAVDEVRARFGPAVSRVEWSADRSAVTLGGLGLVVEMRVDDDAVHVTGDSTALGALLGRSVEAGVKQIVDKTFGRG